LVKIRNAKYNAALFEPHDRAPDINKKSPAVACIIQPYSTLLLLLDFDEEVDLEDGLSPELLLVVAEAVVVAAGVQEVVAENALLRLPLLLPLSPLLL